MIQHLCRRDRCFGSVALGVKQTGDHYCVRVAERVLELLLEKLYLRGVRARFKDRKEPATGGPRPCGEKGFANSRGVVREVIDYSDAAYFSSDFKTTLDAFEFRHCFHD